MADRSSRHPSGDLPRRRDRIRRRSTRDRLPAVHRPGRPRRAGAAPDPGHPRWGGGPRHDIGPLRVGVAVLPAVLRALRRHRPGVPGRRGPRGAPATGDGPAVRTPGGGRGPGRGGPPPHGLHGRGCDRDGPARLGRPRRLVRGGRAGLRPPAQPVHPGRRPAVLEGGRGRPGGAMLARSTHPVLVFETGLPTRYYLDRTDVDWAHLVPSDTRTACPYKGTTSGYWSVAVGDRSSRTWPGPTTSRPASSCPSPDWSPSTTRRST